MINDNEDLFDREKPVESKIVIERKDGEPTPAFKGAFHRSTVNRRISLSYRFI